MGSTVKGAKYVKKERTLKRQKGKRDQKEGKGGAEIGAQGAEVG